MFHLTVLLTCPKSFLIVFAIVGLWIATAYEITIHMRPRIKEMNRTTSKALCGGNDYCHLYVVLYTDGNAQCDWDYMFGYLLRWGSAQKSSLDIEDDGDWKMLKIDYSQSSNIEIVICDNDYTYNDDDLLDRLKLPQSLEVSGKIEGGTSAEIMYKIEADCIITKYSGLSYNGVSWNATNGRLKLGGYVQVECKQQFPNCTGRSVVEMKCKLDQQHLYGSREHDQLLCGPAKCPEINADGVTSYSKMEIFTRLTLVCLSGRSLINSYPDVTQNVSCECDGSNKSDPVWQPVIRPCLYMIQCPPLPLQAGMKIHIERILYNGYGLVNHSSTALVTCDNGYKFNGTNQTVLCELNSTSGTANWSTNQYACIRIMPTSHILPALHVTSPGTIVPHKCPMLPTMPNGQLYHQNMTQYDGTEQLVLETIIQIACIDGFKVVGPTTVECIVDETTNAVAWNDTLHGCTEKWPWGTFEYNLTWLGQYLREDEKKSDSCCNKPNYLPISVIMCVFAMK